MTIVTFVGLASCADELDMPTPIVPGAPEAGYITITLSCENQTSRALPDSEPGVDDLNENKINSVILCLSPSAGDQTDDVPPIVMEEFTNLDATGHVLLRIPITQDKVNRLFNENSDSQCRVFAAVNVDAGNAKTIKELRELAVTSTFATQQKQDSFTMDGDGVVSYNQFKNYAVGEVRVKRSAAKITLALAVDNEVKETVNGEELTWTPNLAGMKVRLQSGVKDSNLDPRPKVDMSNDVYFTTPDNISYDFAEGSSIDEFSKYNWIQQMPFYTYPNVWSASVEERHASFMMLSVPWTSDEGRTWRTCYYHVPIIPFDKFELVRNHSYHVYLHVGVLGSFVPEEPLEVEAEYYVADWGEENIDVDIKDFRYLVVDQNVYTVNNEESITIPFYTSHETIVTSAKMTFYRYNFSDQGSEFAVDVSMGQNKKSWEVAKDSVYTYVFDNSNNTLNVSHTLKVWEPYNASDNPVSLIRRLDGTRAYLDNQSEIEAVLNTIRYFKETNDTEYSRIVYEITVQHKDVFDGSSKIDKNLYKETVKITQYPGMYITAVQNYAGLLGVEWASGAYGNTQISGNYSDATTYSVVKNPEFWNNTKPAGPTPNQWNNNWSQAEKNNFFIAYNAANWNYSLGLSSEYGNWNPNMYLVTVTQLEPGTPYVLGDPRSYNINNFLSNDNVDQENRTVWNGDYYYWQKANGKGPESSTFFGAGAKNPMNRRFTGWSTTYWMEYAVPGFISAPALHETSNRQLQYYYPTREDESNSYTIAPKFRICSSYGGSSAYMTRVMSRRRAAAYQELGYCAGRWRLPTYGEVRYMIDLAAEQKIPRLFGASSTNTWYYWCAQGAVRVPGKTATDQEVFIEPNPIAGGSGTHAAGDLFTGDNFRDHARFVYDEWYWGTDTVLSLSSTPNKTSPTYTFTWGDRPKSNPQE